MIVLVNNTEERDIVISYLNVKKNLEFQPENMPQSACFVIETERGIVVTDKPDYIAYHQKKTGDGLTTFTKFVSQLMLGYIVKLNNRNKRMFDIIQKMRKTNERQNAQVELFHTIFNL